MCISCLDPGEFEGAEWAERTSLTYLVYVGRARTQINGPCQGKWPSTTLFVMAPGMFVKSLDDGLIRLELGGTNLAVVGEPF